MTDIEDMKLPQPIKVKPSIARYLDDLEEKGNTIFAFAGAGFVETIAYLYLLNKYKSKCIAKVSRSKNINYRDRPIGITIPLKINYSKDDENNLKEEFGSLSKILADCVKRGEKTIIIPLGYTRNMGGHANMLILRMNRRELEHYEPHGSEYVGNEKLQLSSKRVLSFFVNILNREFKKDNLQEVKYVDASQVCPYISGFQELEGQSKLPKKGKLEPRGYCAAWSIFFAELCLKNPDMSSSELLDNVYNYLTTKESGPDYLKSVIRGYAGFITQQVNVYLSVFFKRKITVKELLDNRLTTKSMTVEDVLNILVDLETYIAMNPEFDLKRELKKAMKEYRNLTRGKTKQEQIELRRGSKYDKNIANAYYKKRILQNFEEYKNVGRVTSEPVFDSPEEINREQIKNLDILKRGLLHEKIAVEREEREAELMQQEWYRDLLKRKEEAKKQSAKTRKEMKTKKSKTRKNLLPEGFKEQIGDKGKVKLIEDIIQKNNIDMRTKEGQQKLLEILQAMGRR
jgi:hypothetical protein